MGLLSEYSVKAVPGRRFIEVYDADAYLDDAAAMDAARRQVVAGNGYHLYLYSLQADIPAQVDIRLWDAPPSAPGDAEGHVAITLESETGALVVNQLGYGPAGDMALPRPGVYRGAAWWTGRQATGAYHEATLRDLAASGPAARLADDWRRTPHTERYVLDLAWENDLSPLDAEEDW
ncbi:hypothetical protein [Streptomyces sp. E2N166]|uniref:hypothetical protein n=1 Tax=Streptomyces sp. E2N166 TaxID=1851909 RepID=UPI000EF673AC|nr:hypothetical protein [Streptomyces sp. E2N166]